MFEGADAVSGRPRDPVGNVSSAKFEAEYVRQQFARP